MQRTVYNVWGRELRSKDEANVRADKALANNPKIQNLHIAIFQRPHTYTATGETVMLTYYQARWYDRSVAIKMGKTKRRWDSFTTKPHTCNCEYCER